MSQCFAHSPSQRPSFPTLVPRLEALQTSIARNSESIYDATAMARNFGSRGSEGSEGSGGSRESESKGRRSSPVYTYASPQQQRNSDPAEPVYEYASQAIPRVGAEYVVVQFEGCSTEPAQEMGLEPFELPIRSGSHEELRRA